MTCLTNNKKAGRRTGVGKKGSKRVNTAEKTIKCTFNFTVNSDEHGFFITIARQAGNAEHIGHPMFDPATAPESTHNLTAEMKQDTQFVMDATLNKAAGRNYLNVKYNKHLSYAKLAYLDRVGKNADEDEFSELFKMMENSEEVRYNMWSYPNSKGNGMECVSSTAVDDNVNHTDIGKIPGSLLLAIQ